MHSRELVCGRAFHEVKEDLLKFIRSLSNRLRLNQMGTKKQYNHISSLIGTYYLSLNKTSD